MNQVSVIIPTFNRKEVLPRALQSVLQQKGVSFEVLVIDDGSTDGTAELIQKDFPSVRVIQQKNQGPSAARNLGIEKSSGQWLAFLDSDDEWLSGKLKTQLAFFESNPDYKIAQTQEIWIRNGKRVNAMKKHQKFGGHIFEKCLPLCIISPSAVMIHRSVFQDVGPFDISFPACEDYELWLRIAAKYPVGLIEKALIKKYGGHADQLSHKFEAMDKFRIRALQKILGSGTLEPEQKHAAESMLKAKILIYSEGAKKRNRQEEASALIHPNKSSYPEKQPAKVRFGLREVALYPHLPLSLQAFLAKIYERFPVTFQEFRHLVVMGRDLDMWRTETLETWWKEIENTISTELSVLDKKNKILKSLRARYEAHLKQPKKYRTKIEKPSRDSLKIKIVDTDKKIHGDCPVASPETVCCNLKTIDAVENCTFGCSYCTIQTFYGNEAVFDSQLAKKLKEMKIDPNRYCHFGTGQSSDSLVWGNRNGNLEALTQFAAKHPNLLLEFKTKSDNVEYFLRQKVPGQITDLVPFEGSSTLPPNIVLSWSLNPEPVIQNEEHFTASLERRLGAARQVADRGIAVAFHFHPMVYYENWEQDYVSLAERVQTLFKPEEVLFISMGSVTFIKPVIQAIRKRGEPSKILQMELVPAPHNKFTYPPNLKIKMFQTMHRAFQSWQKKVFMYLCMEEAKFWDAVFGEHYATNDLFEADFGRKVFKKIYRKTGIPNPEIFNFAE